VLNQNEWKLKLENELLPDYFKKFEALLKENKNGDGYFIGDSVSVLETSLHLSPHTSSKTPILHRNKFTRNNRFTWKLETQNQIKLLEVVS